LRPTSSVGSRGTRGITLIEMMVVMVVIALIVSITTPSVTAGIDAVRLSTASSSVAAFLNGAANRAERRQRPVELIISPKDRSLRVISTDAGSLRDLILPDGISLEPVAARISEDAESVSRWLFMPGGAVPSVAIQLSNQHGGRRIVKLDPMTGFPRVESVQP
jgi:prepilin-type N-terminal cleavage/methylation domain-containing protein